jgi:hypothetical protein
MAKLPREVKRSLASEEGYLENETTKLQKRAHGVRLRCGCGVNSASWLQVYNAVLASQRVLFVGHAHAAQEVGHMVLGAAALAAPLLAGLLLERAFPYASLTDLRFLEVPGFIAGVTNPVRGRERGKRGGGEPNAPQASSAPRAAD